MELCPVPEQGRHGEHRQVVGDEGGQDDPEEAVEEGEVWPAVRDEAAVSIEHEQAAKVKAEEEGVVVEITDYVTTNDESAAECWSQFGSLLQDSDPAKEEQAHRAN